MLVHSVVPRVIAGCPGCVGLLGSPLDRACASGGPGQLQGVVGKAVGACPVEDSGGIYQYQRLLRILKNPTHREYENVADWLDPEFDPKRVDIDEINKYLANGFAI